MKNKILIPLLVIGGLAAFFSFKYSGKTERTSDERRVMVQEAIMKTIAEGHYSPKSLDDTFSARVFHRLISDFDRDKLFFTKQDMAVLNKYQYQIDDELKSNSIEFFDSLDAISVRRTEASEKYYKAILKTPFTFTSNEVLQLNPDKNDYASDGKELDDRWREYLKYRVLAVYTDLKKAQKEKKENKDSVNAKFKTDAELEAQAREDVTKYYERYYKRLHKGKDNDRFTYYMNVVTETEDPHTEYFPPAEKKGFDAIMSGSFFGIGAQLKQDLESNKVLIQSIVTGSPSWKQGELKAGDEIQKVAQGDKPPVDIQGYDLDEVVKLIRGDKGTEVRLTIKRADGSTKVVPIIRGVVQTEETFAKSAIIRSKDGPVGYIYLPEFYADFNHTSGRSCATDIAVEVKKLKQAGVTGIILDLRNNGGGSLGDVVDMAGIFIGKGPVVQVKGKGTAPSVLRTQPNDSALYSGPLAIMVNEGSASASEILAAALQDYKRAVIVGAMTYGKGTVQKMVDLDQMIDPMTRLNMLNDTASADAGSIGALKLTMEKFYRVNGGSTQLKGVTPDIAIPDPYDSYDDDDLGERHNKAALAWDEIPAANYKPSNSTGDISQLAALSASRIKANPTFTLIQENSEYMKKKRDDNSVSLNEVKYEKEQQELNETSKKLDELQKKAITLDMVSPQADLETIGKDTLAGNKNRDWLKNKSKDIYISETVNIVNDMAKSAMKVGMTDETKRRR